MIAASDITPFRSGRRLMLNKRMIVLVCVCFFIVVLRLVFENVCVMFSAVKGFQCESVSFSDGLLFSLIAVAPAFFLPIAGRSPAAVVLWVVYFCHLVPSVIVFRHLVHVQLAISVVWTVAISAIYCLVVFARKIRVSAFRSPNSNYALVTGVLMFIAIVFIAVLINFFGFNVEPPSIDDVYGLRSEYKRQLSAAGSVVLGYIPILGGFAVAPLLLVLSGRFFKEFPARSVVMMVCSLALSFVIYGSAGFKSVAFASLVAFGFYFIFRKVTNYGFVVAVLIPTFVLANFAIAQFTDLEIVLYHWIRRVFLSPGMNTSYVFDYVYTYGGFSGYPPEVISQLYYWEDGSANSGLFGDAVARFGYIGLPLNALVFAILIKICDAVSKGGDPSVSASLFVLTGYAITNSSITTVIVSYGFLLVVIFLYILRRRLECSSQVIR